MFVCSKLSPPWDVDNICLSERITDLLSRAQPPRSLITSRSWSWDVATHLELGSPGVHIKLGEGKKIFTTCLSKNENIIGAVWVVTSNPVTSWHYLLSPVTLTDPPNDGDIEILIYWETCSSLFVSCNDTQNINQRGLCICLSRFNDFLIVGSANNFSYWAISWQLENHLFNNKNNSFLYLQSSRLVLLKLQAYLWWLLSSGHDISIL